MQVTGYYRDLDRRTLNGDEAEFGVCDDDALPAGAPTQTLCFGADDDDDDDDDHDNGHDDDGHHHAGDDDDGDDHADDDDDHGDDDDDEKREATPLVDLVSGRFITSLEAAGDGAYNRTTTLAQGLRRDGAGDRDQRRRRTRERVSSWACRPIWRMSPSSRAARRAR